MSGRGSWMRYLVVRDTGIRLGYKLVHLMWRESCWYPCWIGGNQFEGDRHQSYAKLESIFKAYCDATNTRYYKRDCRTILYKLDDNEVNTAVVFIKPKLIYSKIRYVCIHSNDGKIIKSKGLKKKRLSLKLHECPAYFFFRVTPCGQYLELVAMNTKHNHDETYISKKKRLALADTSVDPVPVINIKNEEIENETDGIDLDYYVEEEGKDMKMERNTDVEYIHVTYGQEVLEVEAKTIEIDNLNSFSNESTERTVLDIEVSFNYSGMMAPVFTPFKNDKKMSLNMDVIPKYMKYLSNKGIRGILVNGTSGEGTAMSVDERKVVSEKWITCAKEFDVHVMIQVGGAPLPDVLELASHAEKIGANSILCLPELYMKPTTNQHLINYLKLISAVAPKTPLLYYHIPMFSNVTLHMVNFMKDIKSEVPTFSGIKFTSDALDEGADAIKVNDSCFEIFLGADKLLLGAYALGFRSSIATTYNFFPQLGTKIFEDFKKNNIAAAKNYQDNLSSIVDTICKYGHWVSTMKQAMNLLTLIDCGPVRQPLLGLSENQVKEMSSFLDEYKDLQ